MTRNELQAMLYSVTKDVRLYQEDDPLCVLRPGTEAERLVLLAMTLQQRLDAGTLER